MSDRAFRGLNKFEGGCKATQTDYKQSDHLRKQHRADVCSSAEQSPNYEAHLAGDSKDQLDLSFDVALNIKVAVDVYRQRTCVCVAGVSSMIFSLG